MKVHEQEPKSLLKPLFWHGSREGVYLDVLILASSGREKEAAALLSTRKDCFRMMTVPMGSLEGDEQGYKK